MAVGSTRNYWLSSAFFTLLKSGNGLLFSLGSFYFLVRLLDKNAFGVWSLFLGTTTLLEFARNGLVGNAFLKFLASATDDEYPRIVTAALVLTGLLTVLGIGASCALAPWLARVWNTPQVAPLFYGYTAVFLLTGIINFLGIIQQANLQFRGSFLCSAAGGALQFCAVATAWVLKRHLSLPALLGIQAAGAVLGVFIAWGQTRTALRWSRAVDRRWLRDLLGYGRFSFGTILSALIFSSIDQWMLGALLAPAAAATYNIAIRITNIVEVPTGTMAAIVFPQSARRAALEGPGSAKHLYEKSVGILLALLVPGLLILACCSGLVVRLLAGAAYAESASVLHVSLLFCLFIPFARQTGTILDSIGRPHTNFYIILTSAALNVGLNYLFIRHLGTVGAAWGTLCASMFNFGVGQWVLRRQLGVRLTAVVRRAWEFYPELIQKYLKPAWATRALRS